MFGQTVAPHDFAIVGMLIVLEGVLSIDNALVLGLLAKRLPHAERPRALMYGLAGALVFRIVAVATASYLLSWEIAKLFGGAYLLYVAVKHFFFEDHSDDGESLAEKFADEQSGKTIDVKPGKKRRAGFWPTVMVIELTDIAFAVDSILAAIAMVGDPPDGHHGLHPKLWVIILGGMIGVVLMRFAAMLFIRMLERFPRFETAAYLLVVVIAGKLILDWWFPSIDFHKLWLNGKVNYWFWAFWISMLVCFAVGFIPMRRGAARVGEQLPNGPTGG